jgi:hypothetical protein
VSQSLNRISSLNPETRRLMRQLVNDFWYLLEIIPSREAAQELRALLNTPYREFERKWGFIEPVENKKTAR